LTNIVRGWKFPVEIGQQSGRFKTVEGNEDIKEAIKIILTTKIGERINRMGFGSSLFNYVFSTTDYTEIKSMEYDIKKALTTWEPRIENLEVNAQVDTKNNNRILISISYETNETIVPEELNVIFDVNEGFNL